MRYNPERIARAAREMLDDIDAYEGQEKAERVQLVIAEALTAIALAQTFVPRVRTGIDAKLPSDQTAAGSPIWTPTSGGAA